MALLWTEDFESDEPPICRNSPDPLGIGQRNMQPNNWSTNGNNNCPGSNEELVITRVNNPVYLSSHSYKFWLDWRIHGKPTRTEFTTGPFKKLYLGQELWLSWSHWIDPAKWFMGEYPVQGQNNYTVIHNFHARPPYTATMSFRAVEDEYHCYIGKCNPNDANPCNSFSRSFAFNAGKIVAGEWNHFICNFKHSVNNDGFFYLWWRPDSSGVWNGPFQYDGPMGHYPSPQQEGDADYWTAYQKFGIYKPGYSNGEVLDYCQQVGDYERVIYFDNMRGWDQNTTLQDVQDTFSDPNVDPPGPTPGGGVKAFEVLRGETQMANGIAQATITEGVDYTLPSGANATNSFIRLVNSVNSGGGPHDTGNTNAQEASINAYITNPGNLATSITFERSASSGTLGLTWEIICYIGDPAKGNEMVVREVGALTGHTSAVVNGSEVASIVDPADVVVFVTGCATSYANRFNNGYKMWLSRLNTKTPQFERKMTNTDQINQLSYAVVEFTGANWSVDRAELTLPASTGNSWSPSNNTSNLLAHGVTIADITKAGIIHAQISSDGNSGDVSRYAQAILLEQTNIRYWINDQNFNKTYSLWILQNSQASGVARNFKCQHLQYRKDTNAGSTAVTSILNNFTTDPDTGVGEILDAVDETMIVPTTSSNGASNPTQININGILTNTNEYKLIHSCDNDESRNAVEVLQFPQDEEGGEPSTRRIIIV